VFVIVNVIDTLTFLYTRTSEACIAQEWNAVLSRTLNS